MANRVRANGQGTVFKLPNGKWRVEKSVYQNGVMVKRITKSGFKFKREATEYLNKLNSGGIKAESNVTFKEMYDLWSIPHYEKIQSDTSGGYKAAFKRCEPIWYRQFAGLKSADLQKIVDDCPLSRRTKSDIKLMLSMLYKYAMQNDYCDKDYSQFIKLPSKGKPKHDAFTKAERDILWADYNAGNKFTGEILFIIYCGLRFGEYAKTERANMHMDEHYFISGIKTPAGIDRKIPIADCIYSIAKELYNRTDKKYLLQATERSWYTLYHATLQRLKIRDLDAHCCRHTAATALAEAGVQPSIILAILGHENYSMTLNYTHISIEEMLSAVNRQYKPSSSVK